MSPHLPPEPADSVSVDRKVRRAGVIAGAVLLLVYVATAATSVTFWDAGEFLSAFHTWGIPHPPGTPLFVLLGRVATRVLAFAGPVLPGSLLSAGSTALAGAITASLVARWTGSLTGGIAAALCAGATSSVWLNATETEVYASSLCLSLIALAAADRASRDPAARDRRTMLVAYLFGLAAPLHLSAIVASPAVGLLAATDRRSGLQWRRLLLFAGLAVMVAGAGSVSPVAMAVGMAIVAGASLISDRSLALRCVVSVALGVSGIVILLLRSRLDPGLDQGHPATWQALADVVARRQYAVAPLWPRQAPWWLQLANVGQWADWQFGLGLDADVFPSARRLTATIAYALLGVVGARRLRQADVHAWRATTVLFAAGSLGVAAMLNLKAGPSLGWGVLPDAAPHEARERDYFFVLAFWTWGAWAGLGAMTVAERLGRARRTLPPAAGLALAALPLALNWRATTRRRIPEAVLPHAFADALLASAPPGAVLLAIGDNDSYPLWYLQLAEHVRQDVVPVTIPLLGAEWYRAELARRHELLPADGRWRGLIPIVRSIAEAAHRAGHPVATTVAVPDSIRAAIGGSWILAGMVWRWAPGERLPPAIDTMVTNRVAARIDPRSFGRLRVGGDGVAEWTQRLLQCPARAVETVRATPSASLEDICNRK